MKPHNEKPHDDPEDRLRDLVARALDQEDQNAPLTDNAPLADSEIATLLTDTSAGTLEEREALVDRLVQDEDAVQRMQALRPLESWSKKAASSMFASGLGIRTWALAATILLAVGLVALWPHLEGPPTSSPTRGTALQGVVYEPADGTRITTIPEVFRWTLPAAIKDGAEVQMLLFDDHTELLWKSPWGRDGQIPLPPELRSRLKSGGTFFWRLAIDDGLEKRLTFLAQFEIKP